MNIKLSNGGFKCYSITIDIDSLEDENLFFDIVHLGAEKVLKHLQTRISANEYIAYSKGSVKDFIDDIKRVEDEC